MSIEVDIEKKLGNFLLRSRFDAGDEVLSLLGESGCGKSMTLKCIAGIERPDRGRIILDGRILFDSEKHIDLSPQKRRTGLLFQNYALFQNMTVRQNIYAGTARISETAERQKRTDEIMRSFGIEDISDKYPSQLSGGEQQRTALARVLVSEPDCLLLDEPFSALDSGIRLKLEAEMRNTLRDFGKTCIIVSHDRDEVYRLSDRVAVMGSGYIDSIGAKEQIFHAPETRAAAEIIGCDNISKIRKTGERHVFALDWGTELRVDRDPEGYGYVGIRAKDIRLVNDRSTSMDNLMECDIEGMVENPFSVTIRVLSEAKSGLPLTVEISSEEYSRINGGKVQIELPPERLLLLK